MPAYKDKERKTWYAQFRVSDGNGNYTTIKKRGFKTKKEALAYESDFGDHYSPSSFLKISEMVETYLADCENHLRPKTMYNKRRYFRLYILPYFGNLRMKDMIPIRVLNWENELLNKNVSPTLVELSFIQLSSVFNFYVKYHGLKSNPAKLAGCIVSAPQTKYNFWTLDEFHKFLAWDPDHGLLTLCIKILYYTGMRIGELKALNLSDIDFTEGTISISKTFSAVDGRVYINPPKTDSGNRTILIPPFLLKEIKKYVDSVYLMSDTLLFPVYESSIRSLLNKASDSLGLPHIRIHDLRHSNASLLVYLGYSPLMIKERLGHKNIKVTLDTYAQMYRAEEVEVVNELDILEVNMEKNLVTYPFYYTFKDDGGMVSIPDFPAISPFKASSLEEACELVSRLIKKEMEFLFSSGKAIPDSSTMFPVHPPKDTVTLYESFVLPS